LQRIFAIGRGVGLREVGVIQYAGQIAANFGHDALSNVTSKARTGIIFGVRDQSTASLFFDLVGSQTLESDSISHQAKAPRSKRQVVMRMLDGVVSMQAAMEIRQYGETEREKTIQYRQMIATSGVTETHRAQIHALCMITGITLAGSLRSR